MRFEGKVGIVTGGAMGIGRAIVERLCREGASVVIADIDVPAGEAAQLQLASAGHKVKFCRTDVSKPAQVDAMVDFCRSEFGSIDVLVNNAGVAIIGDPVSLTEEDWRRSMAVDLDALWFTSRRVLPDMVKKGAGAIVNVASVHGFQVIKGFFPYPVAKHAVLGLTRSLAIEYADTGVRINSVSPGAILTPLNDAIWAASADPAAERKRWEEQHPVKRLGTSEEVAALVAFLASDEAEFIIGENIVIDGGRSIVH